jgi:serine/threonine protein phosphatase PrpC
MQKFDLNLSGCSGTIVIQTPEKIYVAWVGDCHAMMCLKDRKYQAVKLTQELDLVHTPQNEKELNRIYSNKGEVKTSLSLSGDKKPRVYVRGRMYPGLSTTRSLGDLLAHQIGVTSEPSIKIHKVSKEQSERFIALGTDGIWDNMNADDLMDNIKDIKDVGKGSEYIVKKIRDMV